MNRTLSARGMLLSAIVAAVTVAASAPARAVTGAFDQVPAATLLLPYFEVDLDQPNGPQTRFSIINTRAEPTLAKVTLWSNVGVPTFNFDVYLEGRDTVEIDLRMVFQGLLPQTGPGLVDLGSYSAASVAFPGCTTAANSALAVSLPLPDMLSDAQTDHLAAAHTGQPSASMSNLCAGIDIGDRVARGYATVDVVNQCSIDTPNAPGYFIAGGNGIAGNDNVLSGSFSFIERSRQSRAATSALVHIEADGGDPLTTTPGNYTFYADYVGGSAADNREPAGTVWQARDLGTIFDSGTEVIVWRDPGGRPAVPFVCGVVPSPFPLGQTGVFAFDESEDLAILNAPVAFPNPQPPLVVPFPFAAQRVPFQMFSPFNAGWSILNLNTVSVPGIGGGVGPGDLRQSVVLISNRQGGSASAFLPATYSAGPQHQSNGSFSCSGSETCNSFTSATGF